MNKNKILQCHDILSLYLLNGGLYFQLPPRVHLHAGDCGRVWLHPAELLTLPPNLSQPSQAFIRLDSTKRHITTLSLRSAFLLSVNSLATTPARAIFHTLLKRCVCKLWCCCPSERLLVESLHWSCGRVQLCDTGCLWECIATKWIRSKWVVQQSARPAWLTGFWMAVRPIIEGTVIEATTRGLWGRWWRYFQPPGWLCWMAAWKRAVREAQSSYL